MTAVLRIQRKPLSALTVAEGAAWAQLLRQGDGARWAFLSPTYAEAVAATIGPVDVLLCWLDEELAGVMPLQRAAGWRGRLGLYEPVGGAMTDYCGLLARPGVRLDWRQLLRAGGVSCLYFTHLDESQEQHGLVGESPEIGLRTRIHPQGGAAHWEALRQRDKKLVSDTERRARKFVEGHGGLGFAMHTPSPVPDLEALVGLKNAQYLRTGHGGGALLRPGNVALLRHLLRSQDPCCLPVLSVLRCGTTLVAAHFGLQCGPLLHYWFPVYDLRFAAFSPGRILFWQLLLASQAHGIACIDRGAGDSAAKRDFANEEHRFVRGLVMVPPWGLVVGGAQRACWRWAG